LHVGASGARPKMGVRPDAPTIETIVLVTFFEIIPFSIRIYRIGIPNVKNEKGSEKGPFRRKEFGIQAL